VRFYFCPYTHRACLVTAASSYIIYIYKDRQRPPAERMRIWPPPSSRFRSTPFDRGDSIFELPRYLNHHPKHHGRLRRPCDINRSPPPLTGRMMDMVGFVLYRYSVRSAIRAYRVVRRVRRRADVLGGTCQYPARHVLFTTVPSVFVATA